MVSIRSSARSGVLLESWDVDRIGNQQKIFGRTKQEGAPLSGTSEFADPARRPGTSIRPTVTRGGPGSVLTP
ncbi:hypothetical protein [Mycobacterium tilburgii]|uniref:hypothetical protein n=1 Tax=Mycobacterium tilburgii TaxID=44467 RepID=UPI002E126746